MSGLSLLEARPDWQPNGVPVCSTLDCPSYDGKRCRLTGFRPARICEPAVEAMSEELLRLRLDIVTLLQRIRGIEI